MSIRFIYIVTLLQILAFGFNQITLDIQRSQFQIDPNKSSYQIPFVATLSTENVIDKKKGIDLVLVIDISNFMAEDELNLLKEALKYLVNLMNEQDKLALIQSTFNSKIYNLTEMTKQNKEQFLQIINNINNITSINYGYTSFVRSIMKGMNLLYQDYNSGERIASIFALSGSGYNGWDEKDDIDKMLDFNYYYERSGKTNYTFSLYTFGVGQRNPASLLYQLSFIKGGKYYCLSSLEFIQNIFLKIYKELSNTCNVDLDFIIQSNFTIRNVLGYENWKGYTLRSDVYKDSINNSYFMSEFKTSLVQVTSGIKYQFLFFIECFPNYCHYINIKASIPSLGINKIYYYDNKVDNYAYEVYIRSIVVNYYYYKRLEEGKLWIQANYTGKKDWIKEFDIAIQDLKNDIYGASKLWSKIRELKSPRFGILFSEVSYESHEININNLPEMKIIGTKIIELDVNINYYYFYLKEGSCIINNILFSGYGSSFIISSNDPSGKINITSLSDYVEYYYWNETQTSKIQSIAELNHPSKFIFEKDFPYEFYTKIDGTKDITFNIEFLKLEASEKIMNLFEIIV